MFSCQLTMNQRGRRRNSLILWIYCFLSALYLVETIGSKSNAPGNWETNIASADEDAWICLDESWCIQLNDSIITVDGYLFESQNDCRLSCEKYGAIWPHPTGEVFLSHKRTLLNLNKLRLNVVHRMEAVKRYLTAVKSIFIENVLKECAEFDCPIQRHTKNVYLQIELQSEDMSLNSATKEGYALSMRTRSDGTYVLVRGETVYGARHALETLSNLITAAPNGSLLMVSDAQVVDTPVFRHRGLMLDTARNFMPLSVIYKTLNAMATSKLNVFHWHIVDSQSFPLEIKTVPNLQQFGAYSPEETYSQQDVSNVIKYARLRGIRVLFEIDGPGHAGNGWEWGPMLDLGNLSVCVNKLPWRQYCFQPPCGQLNPFNPNVYLIMGNVYKDILEMGGSDELIHMGGDEVDINCWNSSSEIRENMIMNHMPLTYTNYYGVWAKFHQTNWNSWNMLKLEMKSVGNSQRKAVVWSSHLTEPSKITEFLPSSSFIVHTWVTSNDPLNEQLVNLGYEILVSTKNAWYLDHGFWGTTIYHLWDVVYNNVILQHKNVLGGEVLLWSEYVDRHAVESRIWPRAGAAAERLWSNPSTPAKLAINRFLRYRKRLISRGMHPEAILPKWCELHENSC